MKQILQNLKNGKTEILEIPLCQVKKGCFQIKTRTSLISAGTERMLVEFGKSGYLSKAKSQPDKVKQVWDKIQTDGILPTIEAVRAKLDQPIPLGYCNVGNVIDAGFEIDGSGFNKGDRVISNGPHAEVVSIPKNLCARVPDEISDEEAAFTVVGSIGLQGIRLAQPDIGEIFVVTGLGLIGQLTAQLLIAHGCKVLGIDFDSSRCDLAKTFGVKTVNLSKGKDPVQAAMDFSRGQGIDGVIITASTQSSEPIHQAAQMCRKRGRIVLVGVTGLEINRADFYEKELSFQVSCSYGPGRYDPEYEDKGHDYPLAYVRWTEQRNFEAVLDLIASGKLNVKPLITHRFSFDNAEKAYELITENKEQSLGIILNYPKGDKQKPLYGNNKKDEKTVQINSMHKPVYKSGIPVVGMIGAGNYTGQVLLPAIKKNGVRLKMIASGGGLSGTHLGRKFGFEESTTDAGKIFSDKEINTVIIATRHDSHASFVLKALKSGKNVFVEKPLCLNLSELFEIKELYESEIRNPKPPILMIGFNRRFASHVIKMKELLQTLNEPKSFIITVNAGMIPADHWVHDMNIGGGRIIGEGCHFIDLLRFLADSKISHGKLINMDGGMKDTASIELKFENGSIGTVHYFSNGDKSFPKERLEVFCGGKILQIDNFMVMQGNGWDNYKKMRLWRQDKGHATEIERFIKSVKNGDVSPIGFQEIFEVMKVTILLANDGAFSAAEADHI